MICENCNIEHNGVYGSGRFCGVKCARGFSTKYNRLETNIKVSKSLGGNNYIPKEKNCLLCGKILEKTQRKFCTNFCLAEYIYLISINQWILGLYKFKDSIRCPGFIKKYLLEKYNNSCSLCGWSEINPLLSKPILEIDHIDGNCMNNNYENITLLCPNCHTLTPTYRVLNKGNKNRDQRIVYGGRSLKNI